jgi:hypothetical protein
MCTAGSQTCTASSDKSTTGWGPCTGATGPNIMYRDSDGDTYGDPLNPNQVCPGTAGYVSNNEDCDDANGALRPGVSICGAVTQRKTCTAGSHGVASVRTCDQGCINGDCRQDRTIGLPGYVSCTSSHTPRCLTGDGCDLYDGTCGTTAASYRLHCDGPNDCSGQRCWFYSIPGQRSRSATPANRTAITTRYAISRPAPAFRHLFVPSSLPTGPSTPVSDRSRVGSSCPPAGRRPTRRAGCARRGRGSRPDRRARCPRRDRRGCARRSPWPAG